VGVVVGVDGYWGGDLSDCGGGICKGCGMCRRVGQRGCVRDYSRGANDSGADDSQQGGEGDELWTERQMSV
jgi:hypothetical protein